MGCCPGTLGSNVPDEIKYAIGSGPCGAITIDLLNMYKNPIDCYLRYKLWANIGSSQEQLQNATSFLASFIAQKQEDPDNCNGEADLVLVRALVDRIVKKGICL